ncbi:hypothetical protein D3868_25590 (plasmid) [Azospirillum brasilense]|nr:hypothetical protein FE89_30990 [Azospirillum brasilense]PWC84805.1 hypothetical protein AEJ54_29215 [Azospirillum sp. Sp 7]OPH22199.1 hypothetical protein FE88_03760 [Azospirillum brasilense]QCO12443.1 hypothetical protein D3868_25590 [Azospirillum brasilense]TVZ53687.1 hypothetical protein OH82_04534 [Azospirillum brasilense]
MAVFDVQAEAAGEATTLQALTGDQLVPAEPDAVQWCLTFWRSMQDRLRRQARELEREAERLDGIATSLNVWVAEAAATSPLDLLKAMEVEGQKVIVTYQREGKSGDLHRTVIDETHTEFRHWCVKAANVARLAEAAIGAAMAYCRTLGKGRSEVTVAT